MSFDDENFESVFPDIFKTNTVKYLDLHIDDCLKWNLHIIDK